MTTQESNKLIAEFMGAQFKYHKTSGLTFCDRIRKLAFNSSPSIEELRYHDSWDWLMGVVEEIERIDFKVDIGYKNCDIMTMNEKLICREYNSQSKLKATYNAVIKFIKWHNQS